LHQVGQDRDHDDDQRQREEGTDAQMFAEQVRQVRTAAEHFSVGEVDQAQDP